MSGGTVVWRRDAGGRTDLEIAYEVAAGGETTITVTGDGPAVGDVSDPGVGATVEVTAGGSANGDRPTPTGGSDGEDETDDDGLLGGVLGG